MSGANNDEIEFLEEDEEIGAEDENEGLLDVEVFSCKYCDFQSTDIDELDEHIIGHDEAILEDSHGGDGCFSISSSKNIENSDTESSEQPVKRVKQFVPAFYDEFKNKPDKRVFVCPYCGYQSMKKLDMNKHLKVHNEPVELPVYACAECPYSTRRKCDMPKHLLTHCKDGSVTMYKCNYCPYATKRRGDLPKHTICHKKAEVDSLYQCHQCTYSTRRRGDLKKHLLSHEPEFTCRKDQSLFNCSECGYTSKRLNDLHKHVVLHCDKAVKDMFKCIKCDFVTEVNSHFAKHVLNNCQVVNTGIAIFPKGTETMQDYIVLDGDDLHLYHLDKDSFTSVEASEKDAQVLKRNAKRKRVNDDGSVSSDSDLDNYYVEDQEELRDSQLLNEITDPGRQEKVLVLAGYDNNEKSDCQES